MNKLTLHPMKKIEIIISGEHKSFVADLLDKAGATGYTIVRDIAGKGHHGFHEGHVMFFEDVMSLIMLVTVVSPEKVEPILAGLRPLFDRHSGVMFVSDVAVSRRERF